MTAIPAGTRGTSAGGLVAGLLVALILGAAFAIASLPEATTTLAREDGWTWLTGPAEAGTALKAALPPVSTLVAWIGYALAGYTGALLLVSLRHGRVSLLGWGGGVLVTATCLLHLLAWAGVIGFAVGGFIVRVLVAVSGFVFGIFTWLGRALADHLIAPFVGIFTPLLGIWAWTGAAVAVAVVLTLAFLFGAQRLRGAVKVIALVAVVVAALTGLGWLFGLVPEAFWASAKSIAGTVVGWLLFAFVLATVGQLVLDQLRSGVHAGSGRVGVVMGAIAIGSTLAVLMLVGNVYDAYDFYPATVTEWARTTVFSEAPKFDAAVALAVVGICGIGVLSNLVRMRSEPDLLVFRRSLIYTIMGMITASAIAMLDKATND